MSERAPHQGFITPPEQVTIADEQVTAFKALPGTLRPTPENPDRTLKNVGPLRSFVKEQMTKQSASLGEVSKAMRLYGETDPNKRYEVEGRYDDRLTVVTDLHGMDEKKVAMLDEVAKNPGEAVILLGDVLGSPKLATLQGLYYDGLTNHIRDYLFLHPDATDQELLAITFKDKSGADSDLIKGFKALKRFELGLAGKEDVEIEKEVEQISEKDIKQMRRYQKFQHYGHYVSVVLDENAKKVIAADVAENAKALVERLKLIQSKGKRGPTPVYVMQGNWEEALPIDYDPTVLDKAVKLPQDKRSFDVPKFFADNGINYMDSLGFLETKTMGTVMVPYGTSVELGKEHVTADSTRALFNLREQVAAVRRKGKRVVLISHAVPLFDIHKTPKTSNPNAENVQATKGIDKVIAKVSPDNLIYGHLHKKLKDQNENEIDDNTFNIVLKKDGSLVLDDGKIEGKRITTTYGTEVHGYRIGMPKNSQERKDSSSQFIQKA